MPPFSLAYRVAQLPRAYGWGCDLEEKRTLSQTPACCVSGVGSIREGKMQEYPVLWTVQPFLYAVLSA